MTATPLLEMDELRLSYAGGTRALDGVALRLGPELVGLLGPNGAGKTTLLNVLARRMRPQAGRGCLLGVRFEDSSARLAWLSRIGYLPQDDRPPPHLTGREVVAQALALARPGWQRAARARAVEEALERVGLSAHAARRAVAYSGGMQRRLGLARVLAPGPSLLLVDEPTSGLDPEERVVFRELLGSLEGVSAALVSTHIAADVEVSCSRVIVFVGGSIAWDGAPTALLAGASGRVRSLRASAELAAALGRSHRVTSLLADGDDLVVRFLADPADPAPGEHVQPSLEEAYIDRVARSASGRPT